MSWHKVLVCVASNVSCDRRVLTKAKQHTHRCHGHRMHILAKQWVEEESFDLEIKKTTCLCEEEEE